MKILKLDVLFFIIISITFKGIFAEEVLKLCPIMGKKGTNLHILNIFLLLLRDENPDVRTNLFKKLNYITKVIGAETL